LVWALRARGGDITTVDGGNIAAALR